MDNVHVIYGLVFSAVVIPYLWIVVRVVSTAYFQAKLDYNEDMFRKLEKENCSD